MDHSPAGQTPAPTSGGGGPGTELFTSASMKLWPSQLRRNLWIASVAILIASFALYVATPLIPWPAFPLSPQDNESSEDFFMHERDFIRSEFLFLSGIAGAVLAIASTITVRRRVHALVMLVLIAFSIGSVMFALAKFPGAR